MVTESGREFKRQWRILSSKQKSKIVKAKVVYMNLKGYFGIELRGKLK